MSIATSRLTQYFAAVTYRFPGPHTIAQPSLAPLPYASAAIAAGPPAAINRSAPASAAAAMTSRVGRGDATTIRVTPAARAVSAVIIIVDGSGCRPPGA